MLLPRLVLLALALPAQPTPARPEAAKLTARPQQDPADYLLPNDAAMTPFKDRVPVVFVTRNQPEWNTLKGFWNEATEGTVDPATVGNVVRCLLEDPALARRMGQAGRRAVERYFNWPGQATSYMVGQMKILELRDRARQQLGDRFDIKDFHAVVLENGAVPLDVLDELVNAYIAEKKG